MGYEFMTNTSMGVFQYVFLRLACTVITLVTEYFGLYNDVSSCTCMGLVSLVIVSYSVTRRIVVSIRLCDRLI